MSPVFGISLFLMAFVISALITGSIALAYPAILFFDGYRKRALEIVLWTGITLAAIFIALLAFVVLFKCRPDASRTDTLMVGRAP